MTSMCMQFNENMHSSSHKALSARRRNCAPILEYRAPYYNDFCTRFEEKQSDGVVLNKYPSPNIADIAANTIVSRLMHSGAECSCEC